MKEGGKGPRQRAQGPPGPTAQTAQHPGHGPPADPAPTGDPALGFPLRPRYRRRRAGNAARRRNHPRRPWPSPQRWSRRGRGQRARRRRAGDQDWIGKETRGRQGNHRSRALTRSTVPAASHAPPGFRHHRRGHTAAPARSKLTNLGRNATARRGRASNGGSSSSESKMQSPRPRTY